MGWRRAANVHLNVTTPKSGATMLAVWDSAQGDDLSVTWTREKIKNLSQPTTSLPTGFTEHVVCQ